MGSMIHVKQSKSANSGKFGPGDLAAQLDVSRETLDKLESFVALVESWQPKINLISSKSVPDIWLRHVFDCAQLGPLIPSTCRILADFGSGGGFPGVVLAILGVKGVNLIESDQRKAVFLKEALRTTGSEGVVHMARAEEIAPLGADVVTARALAPLERLMPLAARHLNENGICLFHKGANAVSELTATRKIWHSSVDIIRSNSDDGGAILRIGGVSRVDGDKLGGI